MKIAICVIAIFLVLACTSSLLALEPPTRAELEQYIRDGSLYARIRNAYALENNLVAPELVWSLRHRLERLRMPPGAKTEGEIYERLGLPPATTNTLKSKGTVKVFALLLSFPDFPSSQSPTSITTKLFGDGEGDYPRESLRNYYRRASYNTLEIGGSVLGWYTPSYSRTSMAMTSAARESLIKEALEYYDSLGHDFSQYDNDGNGRIDYFIVIWTGPDNGWANFWWGYQTTFSSSQNFVLDGKSFGGTRYSWQWESRPYPGTYWPYVVIHETGHALGLPDYYDYDASVGPRGGLGGLDMMDANRGDHNSFSKMLLDWITAQAFNYGTRQYTFGASGNTQDALIIMPEYASSKPFDEFYMVQNRFRVENDFYLPGDGLLIWHVDARLTSSGSFQYNNSYTDHKLLRLMEADGQEHIERGYSAHAANYYVQGKEFRPNTVPNSKRYDATDSGVSIFGIGPSGQSQNFTADVHYTLYPPQGSAIQRLESDYIFFREYINKLTWGLHPKNRTSVTKHLLYKKVKGAPDDAYILMAEVPGTTFQYEHRGLRKNEVYSYWVISVDTNGVESAPAEISN